MPNWNGHYCQCGEELFDKATAPADSERQGLRDKIEPWLAALIQSEHLSLLTGNGLTTGTAFGLGTEPTTMGTVTFGCKYEDKLQVHAKRSAERMDRGDPNLEDQLRSAQALIEGLSIVDVDETGKPGNLVAEWRVAYEKVLTQLGDSVVETERQIAEKLRKNPGEDHSGLLTFLLSFANRPATRDRLEIFTTNYDRLIEYACDLLGIRLLDRFVGTISPQFRATRVGVDLHFDPPGIRGEPRYLEGVARLTKLHGSLDWRFEDKNVVRIPLPFGPADGYPAIPSDPYENLVIYPNAAKDIETLAFPYAELFRDFAGSLCRPNSTLFVYGYSFGDDHINRVIREMLTLSSTHVVIMSFDNCGGRLERFCQKAGHEQQITLLVGNHFAHLDTLTQWYLPRTLVEPLVQRRASIVAARGPTKVEKDPPEHPPAAANDAAGEA